MVLGIGEGSIEIVLEKPTYIAGETMNGKVILTLNKPINARGIRVEFYAEKISVRYDSRYRRKRTQKLFVQSQVIGGQQTYPEGRSEYSFSIKLPTFPQQQNAEGMGFLDSILKYDPLQDLNGWFIEASLDIPFSFDIRKKQAVAFNPRP